MRAEIRGLVGSLDRTFKDVHLRIHDDSPGHACSCLAINPNLEVCVRISGPPAQGSSGLQRKTLVFDCLCHEDNPWRGQAKRTPPTFLQEACRVRQVERLRSSAACIWQRHCLSHTLVSLSEMEQVSSCRACVFWNMVTTRRTRVSPKARSCAHHLSIHDKGTGTARTRLLLVSIQRATFSRPGTCDTMQRGGTVPRVGHFHKDDHRKRGPRGWFAFYPDFPREPITQGAIVFTDIWG